MRSCAVLAALAIAPVASADDKAPPPPASLTLHQSTLAGTLTLEVSLSDDAPRAEVLAPVSLAPDLAYGVTDDLTLSIVHSASALTGFRGSAGFGLCLSGDRDGHCPHVYSEGGLEALYSLARGSTAIAANAGLLWTSLDPEVHTDLKLGFKMKLSDGNLFALFSPSIWIALDDRYARAVPHKDQLWLPISVWIKSGAQLALGVGTGVKGPLEHLADNMMVPVGIAAQYAIQPRISVGASFVFGKMFAGSAVPNPGVDARVLQIWINLTSG